MIHQLLHLQRPMFWIDTETTGVDPKSDRIVELGFEEWTAEGMVKEWRSLINPGVPIPRETSDVHHITDETMKGCRACGRLAQDHPHGECTEIKLWPTFRQLAPNLAKGLVNCDFGGKNVRFDLRILSSEFKRAGVEWSYVGARIVDAERLEQIAVPRSLSHLHEKYVGHKHDGAHGALSDVRASVAVATHQLQQHQTLPRDLDKLHLAQWGNMLDVEGYFRLEDGVARITFGRHRGKAMQDVPVNYYDFILKNDFPADVKELASAAKAGKFPSGRR